MRSKIRTVGEGTMAMVAAEGFLARVCSDVSLEKPRPGEGLAAEVTLAGQRVSSDVHFQSPRRAVNFSALVTRDSFLHFLLVTRETMELLVLDKSRIRRVRFLAVGTLITRGSRRCFPRSVFLLCWL